MEYLPPKTEQEWTNQRLVVCRAGFAMLRNISIETRGVQNGAGTPYYNLAIQYSDHFAEKLADIPIAGKNPEETEKREGIREWATQSPSIDVGFRTTAELIAYSVWAYREYHQSNGTQHEAEELRSVLKNPATNKFLINWFANAPNDKNRIREEYFGLRAGGYALNKRDGINPFVCKQGEGGQLVIGLDTATQVNAIRSDLVSLNDSYGEYDRCPAHDSLLPAIWNSMADYVCDNLVLFEPNISAKITPDALTPVQ